MAAIEDGVVKETFGRLPVWARHGISWAILGAFFVVMYFAYVKEPLAASTDKNIAQDQSIASMQSQVGELTKAVGQLVTTVATQQANIENMQNRQQGTDATLNRIENKIDRLRGH